MIRLHVVVLAVALSGAAFAQFERGTIAGSVADPSAAPIPGANVTITNIATNVVSATVSNESGGYVVRICRRAIRAAVRSA